LQFRLESSLDQIVEEHSTEKLAVHQRGTARALSLPPIHVDQVAEVICVAADCISVGGAEVDEVDEGYVQFPPPESPPRMIFDGGMPLFSR